MNAHKITFIVVIGLIFFVGGLIFWRGVSRAPEAPVVSPISEHPIIMGPAPSPTSFFTATSSQANIGGRASEEKCFVGGCSRQICSDKEGIATMCEYREEYACYRGARCERQRSGKCGWAMTSQLAACLDSINEPTY